MTVVRRATRDDEDALSLHGYQIATVAARLEATAALSAVTAPVVVGVAAAQEKTAPAAAPAAKGKLTDASLGTLLKAMGKREFAVRTFIDPRMALNNGHDWAAWAREGR